MTATPIGVGCPDPEADRACRARLVDDVRLRAEQFPESPMRPLTEQVEVEITDRSGDVSHHHPG